MDSSNSARGRPPDVLHETQSTGKYLFKANTCVTNDTLKGVHDKVSEICELVWSVTMVTWLLISISDEGLVATIQPSVIDKSHDSPTLHHLSRRSCSQFLY